REQTEILRTPGGHADRRVVQAPLVPQVVPRSGAVDRGDQRGGVVERLVEAERPDPRLAEQGATGRLQRPGVGARRRGGHLDLDPYEAVLQPQDDLGLRGCCARPGHRATLYGGCIRPAVVKRWHYCTTGAQTTTPGTASSGSATTSTRTARRWPVRSRVTASG